MQKTTKNNKSLETVRERERELTLENKKEVLISNIIENQLENIEILEKIVRLNL